MPTEAGRLGDETGRVGLGGTESFNASLSSASVETNSAVCSCGEASVELIAPGEVDDSSKIPACDGGPEFLKLSKEGRGLNLAIDLVLSSLSCR